jgi:uncharacterized phiE125 gp8 family phage protein
MSLSLVTGPAREPLSIQELRDHLRISVDDDDGYLKRLMVVVRSRCERATRRALITQTWEVRRDQWIEPRDPVCTLIRLPKSPLQAVLSVQYVDLAGVTQTWDASNYIVEAPTGDYAGRGRLGLGYATVWPVAQPVVKAIRIQIRCGYGDSADDVPELLKQAMLLDAGTLYELRSAVSADGPAVEVPMTTREIYRAFRSW